MPAPGPTVSVVIPAHNEQDWLGACVGDVVASMRLRGDPFELVVVENGSTDRTRDVALALGQDHRELTVLTLDRADYGAALRTGFLAATGDVVVNFDVDYYDLKFLESAITLLAGDPPADIVVGTKRGAGAEDTRPWSRRLVTAGFATVLRLGFGLKVSDTHGMKAMRRAAVLDLVRECRFGTDLFDTELILVAERAGRRVAELPVRVEERRPARSSIAKRAARTVMGLVRLRVSLARR